VLKLFRVTAATVDVLDELVDSGLNPIWGLRIIETTGRPAGSVYPILARLEAAGWVESAWDDDVERPGPRRRMYLLTDEGGPAAAQLVTSFRTRPLRVSAARAAWGTS
jgi:DNA-binding PadR family transcriptional regulator